MKKYYSRLESEFAILLEDGDGNGDGDPNVYPDVDGSGYGNGDGNWWGRGYGDGQACGDYPADGYGDGNSGTADGDGNAGIWAYHEKNGSFIIEEDEVAGDEDENKEILF